MLIDDGANGAFICAICAAARRYASVARCGFYVALQYAARNAKYARCGSGSRALLSITMREMSQRVDVNASREAERGQHACEDGARCYLQRDVTRYQADTRAGGVIDIRGVPIAASIFDECSEVLLSRRNERASVRHMAEACWWQRNERRCSAFDVCYDSATAAMSRHVDVVSDAACSSMRHVTLCSR